MSVDVEAYLHEHIPISGHMGMRVALADLDSVAISAPLEPNINHRSTVFGGSCASVAMLAAWSLILLRIRDRGLDARIVIQRGEMDYLLPVDDAFTATCRGPDEAAWDRFLRTVERRRPARIELDADVDSRGRIVARFHGAYAAVPIAGVPATSGRRGSESQPGGTRANPAIRVLTPDDWADWRALRLAALADAPEAFGATVADWSGDRDTEERWRSRLTAVPFNAVAEVGGAGVGMVGCVAPIDGAAELISMWVSPEARGRGVGDALVDAVVAWARGQGAARVFLRVREANLPAIRIYERNGFADAGPDPVAAEGASERRMVRPL